MSENIDLNKMSPLIMSVKAAEEHLKEFVTVYRPKLKLHHIRLIEDVISEYMRNTPEKEINRGVYDILLILDDTVETKRLCQKNK